MSTLAQFSGLAHVDFLKQLLLFAERITMQLGSEERANPVPASLWGWALAVCLLTRGRWRARPWARTLRRLARQLARGHCRDEPFGRNGGVGVSTVSWAARLASEQAPGPSAFSPRRQVPCVGKRAAVPPPQRGHHWGRDPGSGPLGDDGLLPPVCRPRRCEMRRALAAVGVRDLFHGSPGSGARGEARRGLCTAATRPGASRRKRIASWQATGGKGARGVTGQLPQVCGALRGDSRGG